jgi:NAD(P)-dependent dehydrogenase (short-subunit alcohol dehydrogenase family)
MSIEGTSLSDRLAAAFPPGGRAVVLGATGGIGSAVAQALEESLAFEDVIGLSRGSPVPFDLTEEASVAATAAALADGPPLRLVFVASGLLHDGALQPEKALRQIDPMHMARSFAVNAIGPALVLKHFSPLLPREGRSAIAMLSAKVGSIGDNKLGGWVSYRAAKAALNQIIRTAAVEIARQRPQAVIAALHPGTVDTGLSQPFARSGLDVRDPKTAADALLGVVSALTPVESGGFFDYRGLPIPW